MMAPSCCGCPWGWSGVSRTGENHLPPRGLLRRVGEHAATTSARPQRQVSIKSIERLLQMNLGILTIQRQASIRSFDDHKNEVGMPKDFFIPDCLLAFPTSGSVLSSAEPEARRPALHEQERRKAGATCQQHHAWLRST